LKKLLLVYACMFNLASLAQEASADFAPAIEISAGYSTNDISWSIAGNAKGQDPNIYSELVWKNIQLAQLNAKALLPLSRRFIFIGSVSCGRIFSGKATDSDYSEDNRQSRTFFAKMESDKGNIFNAYPGLGYQWQVSDAVSLIPAVGFGFNTQKLYLLDNAELKSTYAMRWRGPFASLQSKFKITSRLFSSLYASYHQVRYSAIANWNLIQSFKHPESFKHSANGYGIQTSFTLGYNLNEDVALKISAAYSYWTTGAGVDELYLADGSTVKTKLNDVSLTGYTTQLGVIYVF